MSRLGLASPDAVTEDLHLLGDSEGGKAQGDRNVVRMAAHQLDSLMEPAEFDFAGRYPASRDRRSAC